MISKYYWMGKSHFDGKDRERVYGLHSLFNRDTMSIHPMRLVLNELAVKRIMTRGCRNSKQDKVKMKYIGFGVSTTQFNDKLCITIRFTTKRDSFKAIEKGLNNLIYFIDHHPLITYTKHSYSIVREYYSYRDYKIKIVCALNDGQSDRTSIGGLFNDLREMSGYEQKTN